MFKVNDLVRLKHNKTIKGVIIGFSKIAGEAKYQVFVNNGISEFYESQIEILEEHDIFEECGINETNAYLTANLLSKPTEGAIYSFNSGKIDFIPYQFRPVLKIIKADRPRLLIADGVGVGKTIETGLILKELQARNNIKTIMVICPKPLVVESKWKEEMRRFGEGFVHIENGKQLAYCFEEFEKEGVWPQAYSKCIIPYSLFDDTLINGQKSKFGSSKMGLLDLSQIPKFDLIVIDEAHHIKNPKTYAYKAAELLCEHAESVVMLTATPIQLGEKDLFVLLNLLRPDLIQDKESFKLLSEPNPYINHAIKIMRGNYVDWKKTASDSLIAAGRTSFGSAVLVNDPTYVDVLKSLQQEQIDDNERVKLINDVEGLYTFSNIINRTRRKDIGGFTVRKPETVSVRFTEEQQDLYDDVIEIQAQIMQKLNQTVPLKFLMGTILRQAASCLNGLVPLLHNILTRRFDELNCCVDELYDIENFEEYKTFLSTEEIQSQVSKILEKAKHLSDEDSKLEQLLSILYDKQKQDNNKVMIFSTFTHTLAYLYRKLVKGGFRVGTIHGAIKDAERVELRNRFMLDRNNPDAIDILLFSEVGCEGLDYQFCDCMINYDLPWNPMRIEQRIGRIDRNGQKSETIAIINMIVEDTIDYDIYDRCLLRIGVFNNSIGDSEAILGDITAAIEDIACNYTLTAEEKRLKLQQLADNEFRKDQETLRLEEEQAMFFGLDISTNNISKEIQDATNVHLSVKAIENLVKTYLKKKLLVNECVLGEAPIKTLRLSKESRLVILEALNELPLERTLALRKFEQYLKGEDQFVPITFDASQVIDNVLLLSTTHPLVQLATKEFVSDKPKACEVVITDSTLPIGEYPYIIYEWHYRGIKDNYLLCPILSIDCNGKEFLESIFSAQPSLDKNIVEFESYDKIDEKHYQKWSEERLKFIDKTKREVEFKLKGLHRSTQARINMCLDIISKTTDEKIIRMRSAQIENLNREYEQKKQELEVKLDSIDITFKQLVKGLLIIK